MGVLPVEAIAPAVKAAAEFLGLAAGVAISRRSVDKPAAAVKADVVVGADAVCGAAHDDDGLVCNLVGNVVPDPWDLLDPARLQPYLLPQPVPLPLGVIFG